MVLISAMLVSCSSLARHAPPAINFTGIWKISHEMSGNPRTLPGIADTKAVKDGHPVDHGTDLLARLESQELRIHQTDRKTAITYGDGVREIYNWGKFAFRKIKSGWEKNHFVIRRPGPGGHMLVRRFILSDGGKSITVVTVFNKMAMTQFYELDAAATKKAFGKLPSLTSKNS